MAWLLGPEQPAMRYLAARDLLRPRPGDAALARLRSEVPKRGWARDILALQKKRTWWYRGTNGYLPYYRATIWHLQVLADLGMSRRDPRILTTPQLSSIRNLKNPNHCTVLQNLAAIF